MTFKCVVSVQNMSSIGRRAVSAHTIDIIGLFQLNFYKLKCEHLIESIGQADSNPIIMIMPCLVFTFGLVKNELKQPYKRSSNIPYGFTNLNSVWIRVGGWFC